MITSKGATESTERAMQATKMPPTGLTAPVTPNALEPCKMGKSYKGDHAELLGCAWLLAQGYQVFRNVSHAGPIDIVIWKASEGFTGVDVTCACYCRADGTLSSRTKQRVEEAGGPRVLLVHEGKCAWAREQGKKPKGIPQRLCDNVIYYAMQWSRGGKLTRTQQQKIAAKLNLTLETVKSILGHWGWMRLL